MKQTIIGSNAQSQPLTLNQETFNDNNTTYIIKGDCIIASKIKLPAGCELIIDGGSITLNEPSTTGTTSQPKGIFLLGSNQTTIGSSTYSTLCLTSKAEKTGVNKPTDGKHTVVYRQTSSVFMKDGDYIKNVEPDNFEMKLTADCRVLLPHQTSRAQLLILSNKVNTIQIDGKCNYQLHAENCKFERIFACSDGMCFVNRTVGTTETSRFDNCEIFASNFDSSLTPYDSSFLSIWTYYAGEPANSLTTLNRLILHDCVVTNLGLTGTVLVDNCTFLFGPNVNNNYETIHCSNHSRITNCIFDGRENITGIPKLNSDVIDTFNGHDIIIDGCTFKDYKSDGEAGRTMITVKSHYYTGTVPPTETGQVSNFLGPQNGVVIRNCFFDLPTFTGSAIEVWNGPADSGTQDRSLNRQFTLIEGNYMEMPKAAAFVNCFRFSDYVAVRNNSGCVNNRLVLVNPKVPDPSNPDITGDDRPNNKAHNLIIEGNILRYQKYKKADVPNGMLILTGTYIDNLVLANNSVEGSLWSMWPTDINGNLSGTIRVINNESIGNVLFRARDNNNAVMPNNTITFVSGNVSNGKKTDIGDTNSRDSAGDTLLFNGRRYFDTQTRRQCIYVNGHWYYTNYNLLS